MAPVIYQLGLKSRRARPNLFEQTHPPEVKNLGNRELGLYQDWESCNDNSAYYSVRRPIWFISPAEHVELNQDPMFRERDGLQLQFGSATQSLVSTIPWPGFKRWL